MFPNEDGSPLHKLTRTQAYEYNDRIKFTNFRSIRSQRLVLISAVRPTESNAPFKLGDDTCVSIVRWWMRIWRIQSRSERDLGYCFRMLFPWIDVKRCDITCLAFRGCIRRAMLHSHQGLLQGEETSNPQSETWNGIKIQAVLGQMF